MNSTAVIVGNAEGRRNYDDWKIITSLVLDGISSRHLSPRWRRQLLS
jgi:hypothetical protein